MLVQSYASTVLSSCIPIGIINTVMLKEKKSKFFAENFFIWKYQAFSEKKGVEDK